MYKQTCFECHAETSLLLSLSPFPLSLLISSPPGRSPSLNPSRNGCCMCTLLFLLLLSTPLYQSLPPSLSLPRIGAGNHRERIICRHASFWLCCRSALASRSTRRSTALASPRRRCHPCTSSWRCSPYYRRPCPHHWTTIHDRLTRHAPCPARQTPWLHGAGLHPHTKGLSMLLLLLLQCGPRGSHAHGLLLALDDALLWWMLLLLRWMLLLLRWMLLLLRTQRCAARTGLEGGRGLPLLQLLLLLLLLLWMMLLLLMLLLLLLLLCLICTRGYLLLLLWRMLLLSLLGLLSRTLPAVVRYMLRLLLYRLLWLRLLPLLLRTRAYFGDSRISNRLDNIVQTRCGD
jgi:hypothetical protein